MSESRLSWMRYGEFVASGGSTADDVVSEKQFGERSWRFLNFP